LGDIEMHFEDGVKHFVVGVKTKFSGNEMFGMLWQVPVKSDAVLISRVEIQNCCGIHPTGVQ